MPELQGSQSVSCVSLFISISESSLSKIPRKIPHCTYVPCDLFLLEDNIPQAKLLSAKHQVSGGSSDSDSAATLLFWGPRWV